MAGYVTQSRYREPLSLPMTFWTPSSGWQQREAMDSHPSLVRPVQNTYTYRSGREASSSEEETELLSGITGWDKFKRLKQDSDRNFQSELDSGHLFDTTDQSISVSHPSVHLEGPYIDYKGPIVVDVANASVGNQSYVPVPDIALGWYQGQAVTRTIPTSPVAGLAVSLAEFKREGMPEPYTATLMKEGVEVHRGIGGEYLNHTFGWVPLVGGFRDAAKAVLKSERIVKQLLRDSGKNVRRSYFFPIESTTVKSDIPDGRLFIAAPGGISSNDFRNLFSGGRDRGKNSEVISVTTQIWFKGAYTYHLPIPQSWVDNLIRHGTEANKILGTELTPEVLWNLQPWSWLVDWKLNISGLLHNADALSKDSLVMRYGYLMVKQTTERTLTIDNVKSYEPQSAGHDHIDGPVSTKWTTVRKRRIKATPYGFGLNPNSFSDRQWAILGALGLAKSPGVLG